MVLLTSSQVSVAISSVIGTSLQSLIPIQTLNSLYLVISFTSALFLSGYVLQQATVRDLRAAIKPQMVRPPPELQIYLPPQFRDEDLDQRGIVDATPVEVETFSNAHGEEAKDIEVGSEEDGNSSEESQENAEDEEDMIGATRWQKEKKRKERLLADSQQVQKPLQQQEIVAQDQHEASDQPTEDTKVEQEQRPLSKAERRKKIKEEILAAGEGESYKGYRRRKW